VTLPIHLAFASVLYLGGATLFGYKPDAVGWLLAAVASLLPDGPSPRYLFKSLINSIKV
jgi:inner membrane protein